MVLNVKIKPFLSYYYCKLEKINKSVFIVSFLFGPTFLNKQIKKVEWKSYKKGYSK